MKADTPLDYAVFQLTPTRTRCELVVSAGGETEKLASGLLKPFLSHIKAANDQIAQGGYSIKLEPSKVNSDDGAPWFTKGTLERFVRFVSTPDVLERVCILENELSQLEEALSAGNCDSFGSDEPSGPGTPMSRSTSEVNTVLDTLRESLFDNQEQLHTSSAGDLDSSKSQLLKALEARRCALQKEQSMAFARAVAAGFIMQDMSNLLDFAGYFGAFRLQEACHNYMSLCVKKCETEIWLDKIDLKVLEAHLEAGVEAEPASVELGGSELDEGGATYEPLASTQISELHDEGAAYKPLFSTQISEEPVTGSDYVQRSPMQRTQSPMGRIPVGRPTIGRSGMVMAKNVNAQSTVSAEDDGADDDGSATIAANVEAEVSNRRLSVQQKISLFEKKTNAADDDEKRRMSIDIGRAGSQKPVLRRWSLAVASVQEETGKKKLGITAGGNGSTEPFPKPLPSRAEDEVKDNDLYNQQLEGAFSLTESMVCEDAGSEIDRTISKTEGTAALDRHMPGQVEREPHVLCVSGSPSHAISQSKTWSDETEIGNWDEEAASPQLHGISRLSDDLPMITQISTSNDNLDNPVGDEVQLVGESPDRQYQAQDDQKSVVSDSQSLKDNKGRLYDKYREKRDAKLREESGSKKAEKQAQLKFMQENLERRKAEIARSIRLSKINPLAEAQLRAEKLRAFKAGLLELKKEKEEEERRRLEDLRLQRQKQVAARSPRSPHSLVSTPRQPALAAKSNAAKGLLPSFQRASASSISSRNTQAAVSVYQKYPNKNRSSQRSGSAVSQSVPFLAELKKISAKPSVNRPFHQERTDAGATKPKVQGINSSDKLQKMALRKSVASSDDFKRLSAQQKGRSLLKLSKHLISDVEDHQICPPGSRSYGRPSDCCKCPDSDDRVVSPGAWEDVASAAVDVQDADLVRDKAADMSQNGVKGAGLQELTIRAPVTSEDDVANFQDDQDFEFQVLGAAPSNSKGTKLLAGLRTLTDDATEPADSDYKAPIAAVSVSPSVVQPFAV